ncbi:SAVED domain-containing protein [Pseudomonas sp. R2.Fl]|nr:SAVED domain-containing protein [Pseudomonas sp. R2.Fl]
MEPSTLLEVQPAAAAPSFDPRPAEPAVPALADADLAAELARLAAARARVRILANAYTVCVLAPAASATGWSRVGAGEFGPLARAAAAPLLRRGLEWAEVEGDPCAVDPAAVTATRATGASLTAWLRHCAGVTGGREGDVTSAIKDELTYLAGWRCQFAGCGRDLRLHAATGGRGRFSYFAHIVAASPDGPRGDPVRSKELASDPANFMLLCDECHRLIDKIHPERYPAARLQAMREDSIATVRRLLDTLQHPEASVIGVLGNIAGQPAQLSMEDAHQALWAAGLRSRDAAPTRYFSPGGQHHDVHDGVYWGSLFQQLKHDLPLLQTLLNGTRNGTARPRVAVFPLHGTSVLLLAGRVLGDTSGVTVFQPRRDSTDHRTRWAWPDTYDASPLAFTLESLHPPAPGQDEAVLIITLTAGIAPERLPRHCYYAGAWQRPTLRIASSRLDKDCLQHPTDLQQLGRMVDEAMRCLQDQWRVNTVHLFVCAPASAAIMVGQKMQARHHAIYVCHEARPGMRAPYLPTIEITPTHVRELVSGQALSHPLQP